MSHPDIQIGLEGPLLLEDTWTGRTYRLARKFTVVLRDGTTITVPRGFETDFASVPRFFWRAFPKHGRYNAAATVHDFLYRIAFDGMTRARADRIFLEIMERCGVPAAKRYPMYWAVRVGGFSAWQGE